VSLTIPNEAAAAHLRQAGIYSADIDALVAALAADGVISGLGVSQQGTANMTVQVAAGLVRIQGFFAYVAALSSLAIGAASASADRIDLVVCDYNGAVSVVAGVAAGEPVAPAIPPNSIALAQVYVPANASAIDNARIYDRRVLVPDWFDAADEFVTSGLTTTGNVGALGWGVSASGTAGSAYQAGESLHPGIYRLQSGGTSGNNARLHLRAAATDVALLPADVARARAIVRIPTITTVTCKWGLGADLSVATAAAWGSAGAFFEFDPANSAKWRVHTREASASTTTVDPGADVVAGNWYQLDVVRRQNGSWQFARNGALIATHSANQPAAGCNFGFLVQTGAAAARNIDIDFAALNWRALGQRWT